MKKTVWAAAGELGLIALGSILYALGFACFLAPNGMNAGGLTGLLLVFVTLTGFGSVGTLAMICNIPLFLLGLRRLGRKFFFGSLLGMLLSNAAIDLLPLLLPHIPLEPMLAALSGGVLVGAGIGLVLAQGASTGGIDIAARLLHGYFRNFSMGKLVLLLDLLIVALTGLVFRNLPLVLYCAVSLYVSSFVMDGVIYGLDDSATALIVSDMADRLAAAICQRLSRGATLLHGQGAYTGQEKRVILAAFRRRQLAELKDLVAEIDPCAFLIVQNAHQVLGEGFDRYSRDAL